MITNGAHAHGVSPQDQTIGRRKRSPVHERLTDLASYSRMIASVLFVALAEVVFSGCSTAEHAQSPGNYIDEKVEAARVRQALLSDSQSAYSKVRVSASNGTVELTGRVQTAEQKQKAEQDARTVDGVRNVVNNIIVATPR